MNIHINDGTTYKVTKEQSESIAKLIASGDDCMVSINGQLISVKSIKSILDDEAHNNYLRIRAGDYKCLHGEWHNKGDRCYGHRGSIEALQPRRIENTGTLPADDDSDAYKAFIMANMVNKTYGLLRDKVYMSKWIANYRQYGHNSGDEYSHRSVVDSIAVDMNRNNKLPDATVFMSDGRVIHITDNQKNKITSMLHGVIEPDNDEQSEFISMVSEIITHKP